MKRRRPDFPQVAPENGDDPLDDVMDDLAALPNQKTRLHQSGVSRRERPPRREQPPMDPPTSERYAAERYPPDPYAPTHYGHDQYQQNQYPQDQYPQEQYPQDQYQQDQYQQGQYQQDQYQQDQYQQGYYPQDQYPQEQYPSDQYPPDRYPPEQYQPEQYQPERYQTERSRRQQPPDRASTSGVIHSSPPPHPISPKNLFGGNLHLSTLVQQTSNRPAFADDHGGLQQLDTERTPQPHMDPAQHAVQQHYQQQYPPPPPQPAQRPAQQPASPAAQQKPVPMPASANLGRLIVLFSTHGGAGCTTLGTNMAAILGQTGRSTCLVDLDLQLGDVLAMLGQQPKCPMSKVARDMENFDWEMLGPMLPGHGSGIRVVSQVGCLEELAELTPARIPVLLRYLQAHFDCIIVDGIRDFNDHNLAALDVAEQIILVATQDAPAIRGLSRRISIFRRLGYPMSKLKVLINRYEKKNRVNLNAISHAVGLAVDATVVNDFKTVQYSLNSGQMLSEVAPESEVNNDVTRVTHRLFDLPEPRRKRRQTLWNRLTQKAKPERRKAKPEKRKAKPEKRKAKPEKRRPKPEKRRGNPDAGRKRR